MSIVECYAFAGVTIGLPLVGDLGYRNTRASHGHQPVAFETECIVYVLERGPLRTKLGDGRVLDARGGMFYTISRGMVHAPDEVDFGPAENVWVTLVPPGAGCAEGSVFDDAEYERLHASITGAGSELWHMPKALIDSLRKLVAALRLAHEGTDPYRLPGLRSAVCDLLVETARACSEETPSRETEFARVVEQYVAAHYDEPLSVSRIAQHIGCDPTWLRKRFKRESADTLNHYIQNYRVSIAEQMLRDTERPITDIALESGFGSSQYFCQVFRKITGTTASAYRRRARSRE